MGGELAIRAAHSLTSHPGVTAVSLLAPAKSASFPTVEDAGDSDVVVGPGEDARHAAEAAGKPVVVSEMVLGGPGIYGASLRGLALALTSGLGVPTTVALATAGPPGGGRDVTFPSPIGRRSAAEEIVEGHHILVARGAGTFEAVYAAGPHLHRTIVDEGLFMAGIALAAGVALMREPPPSPAEPVWRWADAYLRTVVAMGLVVGERPAVT